jgi:hypothetical protein
VTADSLSAPDPAGSARNGYVPYAIVAAIGVLVVIGIFIGADRDPLAWSMPIIVLTGLLLVLIRIIDVRPEARGLEKAAGELGLRHQRARTLPPVTPVLAAVREPRTVQALEGDLEPGGPPVRLATVRAAGVPVAVALTDLPGHDQALEDPHGVFEDTPVAAPPAPAGGEISNWLAAHPLRLGYATGEDALVVFAPAARRGEPALGELLEATRELRRRLVAL